MVLKRTKPIILYIFLGETVKLKWKTVRDGYIKFKKQQKEGKKKVINYIWSSQLKFLDEYQVSRKGKNTNMSLTSALELSEDESETPSQSYSPASILIPSPSDSGPFRSSQSPRRKRKTQDPEKNLSYLKSKKIKKEVENYDATDHLFLSYSQTFKTFSLRQQALLKVELAKLFSNAELNALQSCKDLQESLVAGSSPGYSTTNQNDDHSIVSGDIHTVDVDDDESEDDEIEFVNPTHANGRRSKHSRAAGDITG